MKVIATKIDYDTDNQVVDLPKKIALSVDFEDEIVDKITDITGFCIKSLEYQVVG